MGRKGSDSFKNFRVDTSNLISQILKPKEITPFSVRAIVTHKLKARIRKF
jgi:hypothetical protein